MGTSTCRNQTRNIQMGLNRISCIVSKSFCEIKPSLVIDKFFDFERQRTFFLCFDFQTAGV